MKQYNKLVLLLILSIGITSCNKKMIQIMELKPLSQSVKETKNNFYFDNDTVRITYSFWANHGQFGFTIENRLGNPIYIDWKKSNLVYNNTPNVYWTEETVVKSKSVTTGVGFRGAYGTSSGVAVTDGESVIRPKERITFLPPSAVIERNEYAIENAAYYVMDLTQKGTTVPNESNPSKSTVVYKQNFSEESTPIRLTNFLTVSDKEDFKSEWFIKNSFYLHEISEMELDHFRGKCTGRDEKDVLICPRVLKSDKKYLLYVPKGFEFLKRKKKKMDKYVDPYSNPYQ